MDPALPQAYQGSDTPAQAAICRDAFFTQLGTALYQAPQVWMPSPPTQVLMTHLSPFVDTSSCLWGSDALFEHPVTSLFPPLVGGCVPSLPHFRSELFRKGREEKQGKGKGESHVIF